jgi:hypothetical protein
VTVSDIVERLRTQETDLFRLQEEAADTIEALLLQEQGDASEIEHLKGSVEVLRRQVGELETECTVHAVCTRAKAEQLVAMTELWKNEYRLRTEAQADCSEWRTACEQKTEIMQTHSDERQELQRQVLSLQVDAKQADEFTHKALDERDHYLRELEAAQAEIERLKNP